VPEPARRVPGDVLIHLRRARDHIDRHFAEDLDLGALAATARLSKFHFLRSFAAVYGTTPLAYLGERRVERAQDLLRTTNLTPAPCVPQRNPRLPLGHTRYGVGRTAYGAIREKRRARADA